MLLKIGEVVSVVYLKCVHGMDVGIVISMVFFEKVVNVWVVIFMIFVGLVLMGFMWGILVVVLWVVFFFI